MPDPSSLTSDLHCDDTKLRWLADLEAHAILVAGDLLDIFSQTGIRQQQGEIHRWCTKLQERDRPLIWSSGNHDFFNGPNTPVSSASPEWMKDGDFAVVSDGETRLLRIDGLPLALTTVPWPVTGGDFFEEDEKTSHLEFVRRLLAEGMRYQAAGATWILLAHEPPSGTPLCAGYEAGEADFTRQMIESAQPDFSLHGHLHEAPGKKGGSWIWQLGKTVCLNAGQSHRDEIPNLIELELRADKSWTAVWRGFGTSVRAEGPPK